MDVKVLGNICIYTDHFFVFLMCPIIKSSEKNCLEVEGGCYISDISQMAYGAAAGDEPSKWVWGKRGFYCEVESYLPTYITKVCVAYIML